MIASYRSLFKRTYFIMFAAAAREASCRIVLGQLKEIK
jgi:hypothetical protein